MKRNIKSAILISFGFLLGLLAPLAWGSMSTQAQPAGNFQTYPQAVYTD
jgi:hypothetical protein